MHRTWSNRSLAFIWIVWLYVKKVGDLYWSLHQSLAFHKRGQICCMVNNCLHVAFGILKKPSSGVLDPVATLYLHVLALLLFWSVQTVNGGFNKGLMHRIKLHCLKIPGNIPPSIITIHICTMGRILNRWLVPGERGTGWYSFHIQLLWSRLSGIARETILHPLFPMETMSWFIGSQGETLSKFSVTKRFPFEVSYFIHKIHCSSFALACTCKYMICSAKCSWGNSRLAHAGWVAWRFILEGRT